MGKFNVYNDLEDQIIVVEDGSESTFTQVAKIKPTHHYGVHAESAATYRDFRLVLEGHPEEFQEFFNTYDCLPFKEFRIEKDSGNKVHCTKVPKDEPSGLDRVPTFRRILQKGWSLMKRPSRGTAEGSQSAAASHPAGASGSAGSVDSLHSTIAPQSVDSSHSTIPPNSTAASGSLADDSPPIVSEPDLAVTPPSVELNGSDDKATTLPA